MVVDKNEKMYLILVEKAKERKIRWERWFNALINSKMMIESLLNLTITILQK